MKRVQNESVRYPQNECSHFQCMASSQVRRMNVLYVLDTIFINESVLVNHHYMFIAESAANGIQDLKIPSKSPAKRQISIKSSVIGFG